MKKILSLKSDYLFKLVFGDERNIDVLAEFLSAILEIPIEKLQEIELTNTELKKENEDDKYAVLDVSLKVDGKYVIIEIQIQAKQDFKKRIMYYLSKKIVQQMSGGSYYSKLCKVISINIIDFNLFTYGKYHSVFRMLEEEEHIKFGEDLVEIHFLELKKAKRQSIEAMDKKQVWIALINAETEGELDMLAERNPVLNKPIAIIKHLSEEEKIQLEYEAREKARMDREAEYQFLLNEAMEKVEAEQETLLQEQRIHFAIKLLDSGMSDEQISQLTEIPLEEIKDMLAERNPVLNKPVAIIKHLSEEERVQLEYEAREKARMDREAEYQFLLNEAMEKVEAEHQRREAEYQSKIHKMAVKLLNSGMSAEQISQLIELPLEEVKAML